MTDDKVDNLETQDEETTPEVDEKTDTLDEESTESIQEDEIGEETENSEEESNDIDIDSMSDEEFQEFMNSGKVPESKKKDVTPTDKSDNKTDSVKDEAKDKTKVPEKTEQPKTDKSQPNKVDKSSESKVDYKSVYESIFRGFKANGKEIKPQTLEDVISLMQMGANYTKKMQAMAPLRRVVESLDKAGIKSDDDINFLIDLHNGNVEAIKKLLSKHSVDPVELDMEKTNYTPNDNIISKESIEFSMNLDDIRSSLPRIKKLIDGEWDEESKRVLLNDRVTLRKLHNEIEGGRFELVQQQLELEKTFGRHEGKKDLDIYIEIVERMWAEQQAKMAKTQATPNTPKKDIPDKKGAAPNKATKAGTGNTSLTVKDLYDMSDEEFQKLSSKNLV